MKRKIELPKDSEIAHKLNLGVYLTNIEYISNNLHNDDLVVLQAALQEAYNQGYEDASPKWLPIESAPAYTEVLIGGHDDYDGVTMASRNCDGEFSTDEGFSLPNPRCWMPLPDFETE